MILAAHPPNNAEKEEKKFDERNFAYGHNSLSAENESQKHPCHESDELPKE
jgi:hypothetical protein